MIIYNPKERYVINNKGKYYLNYNDYLLMNMLASGNVVLINELVEKLKTRKDLIQLRVRRLSKHFEIKNKYGIGYCIDEIYIDW